LAGDHKLDIFETLSAIDRRKFNWLDEQPEESRKGFAPPVVLRWAAGIEGSSATAERYLRAVNERANMVHKDLWSQYPDLLYRLLASCGTGSKQRHQWVPFPAKKKNNPGKARDLIERLYPHYNDMEVDIVMERFTPETFVEFVQGCGLDPSEEKEVLKSYGIEGAGEGKKPRAPRKKRS
jgi:hypothetical protein